MHSLRSRLIFSHLFIILLGIPILGLTLIVVLENNVVLVNLSTQLARQAALLAEFSADTPEIWQDQAAAAQFVDRFRGRMTAQLMLVGADGRLLASSDPADQPLIGQVLSGSGLDILRQGEMAILTTYSQDLQADISDIWMPVTDSDGRVVGGVRITHQRATVRERFERLRTLIIQVMGVGLVVGVVTALVLARRLEQPIAALTGAVHSLASGEELRSVPEEGPNELRLLAEAYNTLIDRLRILRVGRRQLMANLIHEMGRPLGAMVSANQALLDGADEEPELREILHKGIGAELSALSRLLDDLRRFYQRDVGPLDLHPQPVALSGWLAAILSYWGEAARQKGVDWQVSIPPDLPTVVIDADRLAQALGNLVSNAIKFTPAGERVRVTAGREGDAVCIAVQDSGRGISDAEKGSVFEPFFRSSSQRLPEGMGLGLTIARDLILAHGGRLTVESELHVGSTFTIWLPL